MYVPKLLAVVHLRLLSSKTTIRHVGRICSTRAMVPTMYRRTSLGLQSLVADGLAALLPHFSDREARSAHGTLGRQFFLKYMKSQLGPGHDKAKPRDTEATRLRAEWPAVRAAHFHRAPTDSVRCLVSLIDLALEEDLYAR
jgi:hypothetical protein